MEQRHALNPPQQSQGLRDLQNAWRMVYKRRWLVLSTWIAVPALVLGYTLRQPKIYQAAATVIIEPNAPKILGGQGSEVNPLGSAPGSATTEYYNTQLRILQSWSLSEKVVQQNHLDQDARLIGQDGLRLPPERRASRATAALQASIRVLPVRDSRVFNIGVRHTNPAFAANLANWIVDVYLEQNIRQKLNVTGDARRWVAEQLDEAGKKVRDAEQAFYGFRKDNNILAVAIEDRQNILTTSLQEFSNALTAARKSRIDIESRMQSVAALIKMDALDAPPSRSGANAQGGALDTIRSTYLEERRKLAQLEQRYGPKHHEVIYAQTRVEAAKADLEHEAKNVMRGMEAEIAGLRAAETRYGAEVERLKEEALRINQKEVDYKRLARTAEDAVQLHTTLQKRFNENRLQEQDEANNIRSLDRARVPITPVEPNVPNVVAFAIAVALFTSIAVVYVLQFIDRTVKSPEDVEAVSDLPVLGFVPAVEQDAVVGRDLKELYILRHPNSTAAESCRVIRTNINFCSPDKPLRSLVITSSNPVEGKTMSVINIGVVMAQGGHRTLIVDSDMRRPRLHKVLKVGNERGLSSLIVGECGVDEVVKSTELANLYVLPCGALPPNPAELLQTDRFALLAKQLLERFDRVLFDSPPLLAVTDGALLSRVVDGTVLVVRSGRTTRDALQRARRHLDAVGAHVAGVVVNDVDLKSARYGGYNYYYYQYYQERAQKPAGATVGDKA
jgi:succinoglycan biosynthesis transport protein ExoP